MRSLLFATALLAASFQPALAQTPGASAAQAEVPPMSGGSTSTAEQAQLMTAPTSTSDVSQTSDGSTRAATAAPAPAPVPTVAAPPDAAGSEQIRAEFLKRHLAYDWANARVVEGTDRQPIDRIAFYRMLDRADLIAKSEAASRRRLYLAIAGGTVAAAGITVGIIELVTAPDLNSPDCVLNGPMNFNSSCEPIVERHQTIGTVALVGGIGLGALLGTLAYWSSPDVLTPDQTQALIARHNAELMKRLHGAPTSLRVTPVIGPRGGGLVASLRF